MSWEPLASSNPIPGDPTVSQSAGTYYGTIAESMADAYTALGVIENMEGFQSDAVEQLRGKAEDVKAEVVKAKDRYAAASAALTQYAIDHQDAQDAAHALLLRAQDAQATVEADQRAADAARTEFDSAVNTSRTSGEELDSDTRTALSNASSAVESSSAVLSGIIGQLPGIVSEWRTKAGNAATTIKEAAAKDDLKDGWWEKWGSKVAGFVSKWAGKIAMWAGIAALVLGWVPILGQILTAIAIIATVAALVADIALVMNGEGDWVNVLLGVIAVASFGVGRFVGAFAKAGAAKGMAQGAARGTRMIARSPKFGSPLTRSVVRNAWPNATKAFKSVPYTKLNPVSWFRSGAASFAGLTGKARFMNFMGHGEAARAYQTLRNADGVAQFAKNATGYVGTMGRLGSLNPAKVGSFGSALVPYTTDIAANSTLLYRDVRTW
ncbi:hypothetical protein [Promicromonospora iranensis]|uniref:Uncharacterized protein n=1 Tax=Promicromonospora iranensis TaxID=1105144 RepID=A0ABU2CMS7_9MICO|nr:hypothetical protein [Promicromonospora iranensis]MDR7382643.1 hypothetical protein [Promicromonospora iranensis]